MEEIETLSIRFNNELLKFDTRILQFSVVLQGVPNISEEIILPNISKDNFLLIYNFYEMNNFIIPPYSTKLISDNLEDNIGIQMDFIRQFYENSTICIQKVKKTLELAYHLNFQEVQDYLLMLITNDCYCGESNEDFLKFKAKGNMDDLTPEEELAIMQAFQPVFEDINEEFFQEYNRQKDQWNSSEEKKND